MCFFFCSVVYIIMWIIDYLVFCISIWLLIIIHIIVIYYSILYYFLLLLLVFNWLYSAVSDMREVLFVERVVFEILSFSHSMWLEGVLFVVLVVFVATFWLSFLLLLLISSLVLLSLFWNCLFQYFFPLFPCSMPYNINYPELCQKREVVANETFHILYIFLMI